MLDTFEELATQAVADAEANRTEPEATPEPEEPNGATEVEDAEPEGEEPEPEPEPDSEDEDSDDTQDGPQPIEVADDVKVTLSDGTELTGKELREGWLRQADYTRKTQELAEERRELDARFEQVRDFLQERAANPVGWVEEIISSTDDPTATLAQALVSLTREGKLDPEFVKTFGLESGPVSDRAKAASEEDRITRLERQLEEERKQQAEEAARQQALNEYRRQYAEIVQGEGLTFETVEQERQFRAELAGFASQHQITDLRVAYDAMSRRRERQAPQPTAATTAKQQAEAEVQARKQRMKAIAPSGGGAKADPEPASFEEAAAEAVNRMVAAGRL